MPRRKESRGTCSYCGQDVVKRSVNKHLATCPQRQEVIAKSEQGKGTSDTLYHLRVQDAYGIDFWLDLEMRGSKTLKDLDYYLRAIWLECCGHMSRFSFAEGFGEPIGMQRKISDVFTKAEQITHLYDFGTTSETSIKLVEKREGKPTTSKPIALMMRNKAPEEICTKCDQPATHLCMECVYETGESGMLCDAHTKNHPHEDYGEPIPLVNSPRLGMCGYDGPAIPPY